MTLAWQIILRARDNRVLALDLLERRAWSSTLNALGRAHPLLAHGLADTHGHLLLVGTREQAGRAARVLGRSLHARLRPEAGWEPARLSPVRDQSHLLSAFRYVLGQAGHHGIAHIDPFQEGTALPDMLGLRPEGAWMAARVRRHLPRVQREELIARLGSDPWAPPEPSTAIDRALSTRDRAVPTRDRALLELAPAVAAAAGRPTALGKDAPLVQARRAALHLARLPFGLAHTAEALGISARTARRLVELPPSPPWLYAVDGQWTLQSAPTPAPPTG